MNGQIASEFVELAGKIALLVEERGWNQEDFARQTGLNRQTVRQILQRNSDRRLRNVTVSRCARALGLSVNELRTLPLERLLKRIGTAPDSDCEALRRQLYDRATQPELLHWIEQNPERARQLTLEELDELLSLQGTGGPLTRTGVEHFVDQLERKRNLLHKVQVIAGTEYLDYLERTVELLYDKIQPYRDRK